jgi:hypothetical protein
MAGHLTLTWAFTRSHPAFHRSRVIDVPTGSVPVSCHFPLPHHCREGVPSECGIQRRHSPLAASTLRVTSFACVRYMDWPRDASEEPLCFFSSERLSVLHVERVEMQNWRSLPPSMQSLEFRLLGPRQPGFTFLVD